MRHEGPPLHDLEARALWHLELGYTDFEPLGQKQADACLLSDIDQDDALCMGCSQIWELCECHVGDDCGRWRNGTLSSSCSKAGSEECDFECPYRNTLRF